MIYARKSRIGGADMDLVDVRGVGEMQLAQALAFHLAFQIYMLTYILSLPPDIIYY